MSEKPEELCLHCEVSKMLAEDRFVHMNRFDMVYALMEAAADAIECLCRNPGASFTRAEAVAHVRRAFDQHFIEIERAIYKKNAPIRDSREERKLNA